MTVVSWLGREIKTVRMENHVSCVIKNFSFHPNSSLGKTMLVLGCARLQVAPFSFRSVKYSTSISADLLSAFFLLQWSMNLWRWFVSVGNRKTLSRKFNASQCCSIFFSALMSIIFSPWIWLCAANLRCCKLAFENINWTFLKSSIFPWSSWLQFEKHWLGLRIPALSFLCAYLRRPDESEECREAMGSWSARCGQRKKGTSSCPFPEGQWCASLRECTNPHLRALPSIISHASQACPR